MFKMPFIAYVSMTLGDLLHIHLDKLDFVRFSHEVKLATGFLVTGLVSFSHFNRKNHVTLKIKLVVICQLTFVYDVYLVVEKV
jgi:hypothetical protein